MRCRLTGRRARKCRACHREYLRGHYKKNRAKYIQVAAAYVVARKIEAHQIIVESKNQPCADCGVSYPTYVMDFDHDGTKKNFNISTFQNQVRSKADILKLKREIKKCAVVCSNCHRERTHGHRVRDRLERPQRRAHNPNDAGSNPAPATFD